MMVLFMAPFYAITSFLAIITSDTKGYWALIRDIYEAVLIYAFFLLLSSYLAYDMDNKSVDYERIYDMLSKKGLKKHIWPLNYIIKDLLLISNIRGKWFFRSCRMYILQYLAIKPLATFIIIILYIAKAPSWLHGALQFIVLVSVSFSMYYLVLFYQILNEELAYARPLLKFLSVKSVLFLTFWQEMVIHAFKSKVLGFFGNPSEERGQLLISVLECLLVCFEMLILSLLTTIAFSYKDFRESQKQNWLLEEQGVMDLGKKFMNSVMTDNIVTTLEDLKDLKDPFTSFKPSEIKKNTISDEQTVMNISMQKDKDHHAQMYEAPRVIPDFIKNK